VVEGLTPFIVGYSYGAYSESRMSVMVGVIGVRINYENGVVRRLKELEVMGVRTVVLVRGREEDEKETTKDKEFNKDHCLMMSKITNEMHEDEDYAKSICTEYVSRGWIAQEAEEMIDFPALKQAGGDIRCEACFLSRCDCKDRVE